MKLIEGRPDLPPKWDGEPVEWTGWSAHRTTLPLHVPADSLCCRECGTVDEPLINFGIRPPDRPTYTSTRIKTTRSGKQYEVPHERPARPIRDLIAARCRHCRHDVVTDLRTDEVWDLEDEDYQPEGSYPTDTLF